MNKPLSSPQGAILHPTSVRTKSRPSAILMICVSVAAGFIGGWAAVKTGGSNDGVKSMSQTQQYISSESEVISKIAKEVGQSVVSIDVVSTGVSQDFFGFQRNVEEASAGTGVIISDAGVVVTNKHVVPVGTSSLEVTLSDGTVLEAEVLARDPRNDIAFLKIKDKKDSKLVPAKLGDSTNIEVGDKVIAIGNALGEFQNTVTSGIVSGYGREITAGSVGDSEDLTNLIQTDAAINRGNSGGPLVNIDGEVIGINTAITGSDNGQSLGFSIPVNDIKNQIESVLSKGKIERTYLGVRYRVIDERFAYVYNLPVKKGAYIPPTDSGQSSIIKDSPAEKSGLKEKDIITKIDDKEVDEKNNIVTILGKYRVGDVAKFTVLRGSETLEIDIKLESAPES
jgi:serine protease Do